MSDLFQSTFRIQKHLEQGGIQSAVIGGLAVAIWGEPRLTADVDLKVLLGRDESSRLVSLLGAQHYLCLSDNPENTLQKMGFLFVKDADDIRIDLLLADTPFDAQVIQRARSIEVVPKIILTVCKPEDLIIYKMISTRARDMEDVHGIILRQKGSLDDKYVIDWLAQFEKALDDSTLVNGYRQMRHRASVL